MLNQQPSLDLMFQALADGTRRAIVERLSRGPASVSELAQPFAMSMPAVLQHLQLLEASGVVRSEKLGRVRTCSLAPEALSRVERWIGEQRTTWERRLDRLGAYLDAIAETPIKPPEELMTDHSAVHASFTLERTYVAAPERVFAAFASAEAKARWFAGGDDWTPIERELEFRIGGRELAHGRWKSGMVTRFECRYFDIVPNERIVYAYSMHLNDRRISVSLATIEFKAAGSGTRLALTEQGAFLDGYEDGGGREHGTGMLLGQLAAALGEGSN